MRLVIASFFFVFVFLSYHYVVTHDHHKRDILSYKLKVTEKSWQTGTISTMWAKIYLFKSMIASFLPILVFFSWVEFFVKGWALLILSLQTPGSLKDLMVLKQESTRVRTNLRKDLLLNDCKVKLEVYYLLIFVFGIFRVMWNLKKNVYLYYRKK